MSNDPFSRGHVAERQRKDAQAKQQGAAAEAFKRDLRIAAGEKARKEPQRLDKPFIPTGPFWRQHG